MATRTDRPVDREGRTNRLADVAVQHEPRMDAGLRAQRRLRHQDLGRQQLLDAAEDVFGRKGFHDTTLREIAQQAEFSVGSVYSFFDSKDDLFLQIFVRRGGELLAEIEAVSSGAGTALDQLHLLVDTEVGFFRRHPNFARLMLRYANVPNLAAATPLHRRVGGDFERATTLQAEIFARGQATGELRDGDAEALSRIFSGLVLSFQTLDVSNDTTEWLPLDDFHEIVERAFAR